MKTENVSNRQQLEQKAKTRLTIFLQQSVKILHPKAGFSNPSFDPSDQKDFITNIIYQ